MMKQFFIRIFFEVNTQHFTEWGYRYGSAFVVLNNDIFLLNKKILHKKSVATRLLTENVKTFALITRKHIVRNETLPERISILSIAGCEQ